MNLYDVFVGLQMYRMMIFFSLFMICLTGCGKNKPPGFPDVYQTHVIVKDGEEPLSDIQIMLYPQSTSASYSVSGVTDSKGVAVINCIQGEYIAKGAPADNYTVTVADIIKLEHRLTPEERSQLSVPEARAYTQERKKQMEEMPRKIPAVLSKENNGNVLSPLTMEVPQEKNEFVVDISKYK